jgi:hypothetical protein
MTKIWIDDVRPPPGKDWLWCKDYDSGFRVISLIEDIEEISFDHDLGYIPAPETTEKTGYDLLKFFLAMNINNLHNISIHIHSMNIVGRKRMIDLLNSYSIS